jgi:microcystin-dependent protein
MIATEGYYPSRTLMYGDVETEPIGADSLGFVGEITLFAGSNQLIPDGWLPADGRLMQVNNNETLFSLIGTTYGGDGRTNFALPDLRGRAAVHSGGSTGPGLTYRPLGSRFGDEQGQLVVNTMPSHAHVLPPSTGVTTHSNGFGHNEINMQPSLAVNYIVAISGIYPPHSLTAPDDPIGTIGSGEPYLGSISMFAGNFAPRGWAFANGQLLPIAQNQSLFSLFGTTYGGDGRTTFALPDLRGRAPVHSGFSTGPGAPPVSWGEKSGTEVYDLALTHLPTHMHTFPDNITADFNFNGRVGVEDLIIWAQHFGDETAPYEHGDADLNTTVGVPDLILWAQHFGMVEPAMIEIFGASGHAIAVPEPSFVTLWCVTGMALVARRRGRGVAV